ncbi:MAG: hypothetical protein DRP45_05340, partial [Candidatus Zixiibacteriota bacterium]
MPLTKHKDTQTLRVWEMIRIIVGEGSDAGHYRARIEDMVPESLVITAPVFVSGKTLLRHGLSVNVQITREDAAYGFQSVVRVEKTPGGRRTTLTPPTEMRRVQRRLFARAEIPTSIC